MLFYPYIGPNREYLFTAKISGYTVSQDENMVIFYGNYGMSFDYINDMEQGYDQ